jgi:aminopeptidase N
VFSARKALRTAVGATLHAALADTHRRLADHGSYQPDAASAGRRALRNICLDLMVATQHPEAVALAAQQYRHANNMTDRIAALSSLSQCDAPERATALDDFSRRYESEPLIIDKWLALQATIPEPATLDRVKALTRHPAFSFANPNRIRALIGSFAQANHTQFNRPDGLGFEFVADTVLSLDGKNPQVAARLLSAFRSWRALESVRRARAEAALRRVASTSGLSRDVADIAQRSLGEN